MTHDTGQISSLALGFKGVLKIFSGSGSDWLDEIMNDKGVCRTVPATPGLLISGYHFVKLTKFLYCRYQ